MLKRELKVNLKSLIIWTLIIVGVFIIGFLVYPSIIQDTVKIEELVNTMPKEILEIFNMDIISLNSVSGWLLTEGYLMVNLLGSCFFAILGGSILLKEENDKTIDFLFSKPIKKSSVVTSRLLTGLIYIIIFNLIISLTTLIGLNLSNDFNSRHWILSSIAPVFIHVFFFCLSLLLSNYFKKTNKSITFNIGIVLGTYLIGVISLMNDKLELLKYLSPFEYINSEVIVTNNSLDIFNLTLLTTYTIITLIGLYSTYNKKELGL